MRPQDVYAASPQGGATLLYDFVRFFLVYGVRQRVRTECRFLSGRRRQVGPVCRDTTGKDELLDPVVGRSIHFSDSFHYACRAGHIDLPHALDVEHTRAHRINHEGQVDDGEGTGIAKQFVERSGG